MSKPLTIWFNDKGNMLPRASGWHMHGSPKSEVAQDFQAEMTYKELGEYDGSVRAVFISSSTGREYCMFLDHFDLLIKAHQFIDNKVQGTFRFVKHGAGQGIKLLLPAQQTVTEEVDRQLVLQKLCAMSHTDLLALGQRAGIYTQSGELTEPYRDDDPTP